MHIKFKFIAALHIFKGLMFNVFDLSGISDFPKITIRNVCISRIRTYFNAYIMQ